MQPIQVKDLPQTSVIDFKPVNLDVSQSDQWHGFIASYVRHKMIESNWVRAGNVLNSSKYIII